MRRRCHQIAVAKEPRGFTLTELLLVMSLIVLLGGLGGGLYVGSYKRLLVEKTARQFLLAARYARIMAIERQRPYELQLLNQESKGFLLATTQTNTQTGQTERTIVQDLYCRPVQFKGDIAFENVRITTLAGEQGSEAEPEFKILFLPNGSAESAVIQIGDGKTHYTVAIVAATGKASVYTGTADKIRTTMIDLDMQPEGYQRAPSRL